MPFIIIGAVLILGAVGLVLGSQAQKRKLAQIKGTQTSTSAELADLAASVAKEIGAGSFNQIAEVKGTVECAEPLESELSRTACIYYSMNVTREYEETYWENDDKGNRRQRIRRGSESVASNTRSVPFFVRDTAGTIAVDPDGASFVAEKVFSQFKQGDFQGGGLQFGRYSFDPGRFAALAGGRRTIGYRFEESAVPIGRTIYVLGEAVDSDGRLRICKPDKKGASFIVSLKSEEQLVKGAQSTAKGLTIVAVIAGVLGVAGVVLGILKVI
ncbi:MAG: E3 ubiquitin ligase family protein [Spirochaetota bacterium]